MGEGGERRAGLIPNAVLLAGPTAGGKSALALALAQAENRVVVNADSMQVYAVLEKITARPGPDALAQAPHLLYGHVHPSESYSVGRWAEEVRRLHDEDGLTVFLTTQYLEEADRLADRLAIIDGGRIVAEGTPARLKASVGVDVVDIAVPTDDRDRARQCLLALDGLNDLQRTSDGVTAYVVDGPAAVAGAVRLLEEAGVPIGAVRTSSPTLDDVFLIKTGQRLGAGTASS